MNGEMQRFTEYCLSQYGLDVLINDNSLLKENAVIIDFNSLHEDLYIELKIENEDIKVYADRNYFTDDDNVLKLTEYGVSQTFACASIPKIPFTKVYVKHK
jgi:hypothetical protein